MGFKKFSKGTHNAEFFMAEPSPFIVSTARDYDMDYNDVMKIYNNNITGMDGIDTMQFYADLEEFIKNRSENS